MKYITDQNGVSPLLIAMSNKNDRIISLLLEFICKSKLSISQLTNEEFN